MSTKVISNVYRLVYLDPGETGVDDLHAIHAPRPTLYNHDVALLADDTLIWCRMPELPEVEAAVKLLRRRVTGRTIVRVRLLHPAMQRQLTPAQLRILEGARITCVERRGKHQFLHLADGAQLHVHFRMNGAWTHGSVGDETPRFARAVFEFSDGSCLAFVDSRALGTIALHVAGAHPDLALGPDASDKMWTSEHLAQALAERRTAVKTALLDQRVVAGLGNIYSSESLWRARIDPRLASRLLTPRQVKALRRAVAFVLARATGARYTDESTVDLDVYDREGLPCRRCRTQIERIVQAGRSTYFCPACQAQASG